MRVVSLFSGAGGFYLGFVQAGHEVIWATDYNKDCAATYHHNICKGVRMYAGLLPKRPF